MASISKAVIQQAITWRQAFHTHPEIGLKEYKTSSAISEILQCIGKSTTAIEQMI